MIWQKTQCKHHNKFFMKNGANDELLRKISQIQLAESGAEILNPLRDFVEDTWVRISKQRGSSKQRLLQKVSDLGPRLDKMLKSKLYKSRKH